VDLHGHQQVPHVVKIGPQGPIGQEREAFEQIEGVLGNNAPRITDFADSGERGALKYRYAAMGGSFSKTFQKLYCAGLSRGKTEYYLAAVFREQLGRFYQAATLERANLLEYYWFRPDWAPHVRKTVEQVLGKPAKGDMLSLTIGQEFPNPCLFYERDLAEVLPLAIGSSYFSYIHGDLNGANIIIDAHDNVWLIDFFHTHRGHILKDLIKLENDLLYIFTPVNNTDDLAQALHLTDCLLHVEDLGQPLPDIETTGLTHPEMRRAYETICFLRSFYPLLVKNDRNPLQLLIGQLRYAAHTLLFDESNAWQKQWALYTAGWCSTQITRRLKERGSLRIDWLNQQYTGEGRLGLTILPGRKDYGRSLPDDLAAMKAQGVSHVVPLLTDDEFSTYGIDDLLDAYQQTGFIVRRLPILDQSVCSLTEMRALMQWLTDNLVQGANIMIHCVGGLGRSGLVAACFLRAHGLKAETAIEEVRRTRSSRAIESAAQKVFIRNFERVPVKL
jgi:protein-tyrosine phosphatase